MSETPIDPTDDAAEFSFDDWIEAGTTAQRTVTLYNDRAIPDRLEILQREREIAAALAADDSEATITDVDPVAAIDEQISDLYDEWQASKETWVVRALSKGEVDAISKRHPVTPMPKQPGKQASRGNVEAHEAAMQVWAADAAANRDAANLDTINVALLRVETAKGTFTKITTEQLAAIKARPGRQGDIVTLMNAVVEATNGDVEVAPPFSHSTSRTAQS